MIFNRPLYQFFQYYWRNVEIYGQSIEFSIVQKVNRIHSKDDRCFTNQEWVTTDKLEFNAGRSYRRKNWIDDKTKRLEDDLPAIYPYIEQERKRWHDLRKRQDEEQKVKDLKENQEKERSFDPIRATKG
jgi:hypothetical protein